MRAVYPLLGLIFFGCANPQKNLSPEPRTYFFGEIDNFKNIPPKAYYLERGFCETGSTKLADLTDTVRLYATQTCARRGDSSETHARISVVDARNRLKPRVLLVLVVVYDTSSAPHKLSCEVLTNINLMQNLSTDKFIARKNKSCDNPWSEDYKSIQGIMVAAIRNLKPYRRR